MIKHKSTCGLCKPHKKWKKNDTKKMTKIKKEISGEVLEHRVKVEPTKKR